MATFEMLSTDAALAARALAGAAVADSTSPDSTTPSTSRQCRTLRTQTGTKAGAPAA
jgi:hypothetical protein